MVWWCRQSMTQLWRAVWPPFSHSVQWWTSHQAGGRWQPGRGASAALESVWSVTDPPLKALRRVIPPLRIGNVSLDLAFIVLLVILFVLMEFVLKTLILNYS